MYIRIMTDNFDMKNILFNCYDWSKSFMINSLMFFLFEIFMMDLLLNY